jgi:hypothetical protein
VHVIYEPIDCHNCFHTKLLDVLDVVNQVCTTSLDNDDKARNVVDGF